MAKSKEELISMIENDLVDPSTNKITGERVKNALTEMVDAMGTGGGAMEYWRVPENFNKAEEEDLIFTVASQMKWKTEEMTIVGSPFLYAIFNLFPSAFSVNMSAFVLGNGQLCAVTDFIAQSGIDLEARGYTRITEEEFYAV